MRTCPNCGNKVSDIAKFCVECGTKLEEKKEIFCPNCNSLFTGGKFCMECGYNMQDFLNKKKVEKKNDDLILNSLDFDPFDKSNDFDPFHTNDDFDFNNTNSLLDSMIKEQNSEKALKYFKYEKYGDSNYIIVKFIDALEVSIIVPNSVISIEAGAFENSLVTDVKLPEGLKKIGRRAFAGCKYLKKLNIPSTVVRIDDEAFIDCVKLDVEIPNSVQILGDDVTKNTLKEIKDIKRKEDEEKRKLKAIQEAFNKLIDDKIKELKDLAQLNKLTFSNEYNEKMKSSKNEKELKNNYEIIENTIKNQALLQDKDGLYNLALKTIDGKSVKKDENKGYEYLQKAADLGHVLANLKYGLYLCENKNYEKAVKYLEVAEKNGEAEASEKLGKIYSTSYSKHVFSKKDDKISLKYFINASKKDLYTANYEVAYMYYNGFGTTKDYKKALEYLLKSSKQNHPKAFYLLARIYENGYSVEKDNKKAFDYYLKSSELGYDYASYCVGWYYKYGRGVAQNSKKAFEYFSKSADSNIYSKFELAELYLNGEGTTKDPAKAIKLHLELAQNSHADSYRSLGDIYFYGKGVSVNYSTAETYYKKAIDNNAPNMNKGAVYCNIGYCYEQLKKPYEAFKYMKMAAENNHADAMNRLGIFYELGTGTSKNIREAMKWYEKSGDGGISYGYYNLALVYHYAKDGISYDAQKAKTYYTKAKNLGNSDAADQLKKL